jgi:alkanesulfonate monooxygenase SsuD/methylene tetrahydromethanopterin reductase-like flavin-dependent oxidoreductase (luciferase family)
VEVFVFVNAKLDAATLAAKVHRWEALGLTGVLMPDHFFVAGDRERSMTTVQPDPFVVLPAIGAMSSSLSIGTIVANCNLVHPAWILRHLSQLSALFGGHRVVAGLGAGWNTEEFDALGMTMPPYEERLRQLEETLQVTRQLFYDGSASFSGRFVTVRDLPTVVGDEGPPRILVGGGSDQILELAARYADQIDLNGSSRRAKLGRVGPAKQDMVRRLTTTVGDLEGSVRRLRELVEKAGREPGSLRHSVLVDTIDVCDAKEVGKHRAALAQSRGVDDAGNEECPYVLVGPVGVLADTLADRVDRLDLSALLVFDGPHLEVLMNEIVPQLVPRLPMP